jgi:hypothetical protein
MANVISENAQVHISVAFLIKAMVAVGVAVSSFFQTQNEFAEQEKIFVDLENKATVLRCVPLREWKYAIFCDLEEDNKVPSGKGGYLIVNESLAHLIGYSGPPGWTTFMKSRRK